MLAFSKISNNKRVKNKLDLPISLIICFKNEAENLSQNFQHWTSQLNQDDELILMNDFSSDESVKIVKSLSKRMDNIKLLDVSDDLPGKKQALSESIAAAKHNTILVTDADCIPSPEWRSKMAAHVEENTDFVLGYGPIQYSAGILNLFQRFECVMTALQYFSYASCGLPYMGVGRNMLFKKAIFDEAIFKDKSIASGDDDMLVSAKANSNNTELCLDSSSFVVSKGPKTWYSYFKQKTRHVTSSVVYKPFAKFLLGLFAFCQILTLPFFIFLLFTCCIKIVILLYLLRIVTMMIVLKINGNRLQANDLYVYTPLLDVMLSIYYLLLSFLSLTNNKSTWN